MLMMFVVGRLAAKVQPKYLIVAGAVIIAISMYQMTNVYGDLDFWYMARSRGAQTCRPIGVSIVSNVLTHREQFHQNRLVESVLPSSVQYQDTLHRVTDYFVAQGNSLLKRSSKLSNGSGTGAGTGLVPRLHGCLLAADADLTRRHSARGEPAQGQAGGPVSVH